MNNSRSFYTGNQRRKCPLHKSDEPGIFGNLMFSSNSHKVNINYSVF
jgi:hypothetical protein